MSASILPSFSALNIDVKRKSQQLADPKACLPSQDLISQSTQFPFDTKDHLICALNQENRVVTTLYLTVNGVEVNLQMKIGDNKFVMLKTLPQPGEVRDPTDRNTCFELVYEPEKNCLHINFLFYGVEEKQYCTFTKAESVRPISNDPYRISDALFAFTDQVAALLEVNYTYLEDMMILPDYTVDLEEEDYLPNMPNMPFYVFQNEEATKTPPAPLERVTIKGGILKRVLDGTSYYEKRGFFFDHWQFERPLKWQDGNDITPEQSVFYPIDSRMEHYTPEIIGADDQTFVLHVSPYSMNPYRDPTGNPIYELATLYNMDPTRPNIGTLQRFMTMNMSTFLNIDYNTRSVSSEIEFSTGPDGTRFVYGINPQMAQIFNLGIQMDQDGLIICTDQTGQFENDVFTPWYLKLKSIVQLNRFNLSNGMLLPLQSYMYRILEYLIAYKTSMNVQITELSFQTIQDYVNGIHTTTFNSPLVAVTNSIHDYMLHTNWTKDDRRLNILRNFTQYFFDVEHDINTLLIAITQDGSVNQPNETNALQNILQRMPTLKPVITDSLYMFCFKVSKIVTMINNDSNFAVLKYLRRLKAYIVQRLSTLLYGIELLLDWRQRSFNMVINDLQMSSATNFQLPVARKYYFKNYRNETSSMKVRTDTTTDPRLQPTRVMQSTTLDYETIYLPFKTPPGSIRSGVDEKRQKFNFERSIYGPLLNFKRRRQRLLNREDDEMI
jgi:hypothetical protein